LAPDRSLSRLPLRRNDEDLRENRFYADDDREAAARAIVWRAFVAPDENRTTVESSNSRASASATIWFLPKGLASRVRWKAPPVLPA
jgi:hypothetical protein